MTKRLPLLLAVVLPLLVWGGALYLLGAEPTKDQERQLRNAGMLLNGEVLERPAVDVIDELMARAPRLVILGNSFANTNVQLNPLVERLGLGRSGARLSIPNTIGAHWYAMLKYRVFVDGHPPPDVVLIASDLQSALLTTPLSEGSAGNLAALTDGAPDPLLQSKVGWTAGLWWASVLEGRRQWRYAAVATVKDNAARILHRRANAKRLRKLTNDAMDQVFDPAKTIPSLAVTPIPTTALGLDITDIPAPADSFVEAMAALCYEHGARLVFVRNRESPLIAAGQGDVVQPGTEAAVRALIEPYGGELLDFRRLGMIAEQFDNIDHMTREGSKRFTSVLVAALEDIGVPSTGLARPPAPTYTGPDASPYPQVRKSWRQLDAPARWSFPAWDVPAEGFRIQAALEGGATLWLDGVQLEGRTDGPQTLVDLHPPVPRGPFVIEARGPGLITALAVGEGAPRLLVGHRSDLRADRLPLLATPEVFDGEVYFEAPQPRFASPPPPVGRARRPFAQGPQGTGSYDVGPLRAISDQATRSLTPFGARCSPLRVSEDGVLLPLPNVGCAEVRQRRNGRSCHSDQQLAFAASDLSNPARNGRSYQLELDPERRCDGGFWLYPGDAATLEAPPARLLELRAGVRSLALDVAFPAEGPARVEVDVRVDGAVVATDVLDRENRHGQGLELPWIAPTQRVELVFRNTEKGFALVNAATLQR